MTADTQLTIAQELDQALVANDITEERIQKMMERALPHARPIEDEDQYKAAEKARLEIRKVRLIGEKGIEAVDRRYLDLRQASLAKKKELLEKINAPELLILQHTRAYEKKKQEEEQERQRLITEMQEQRKADILATGATFTPGSPEHRYTIGGHSWTAREINEADHETWGNMLRSARMVQEEIQAARAQQELEAQQERERIAREQEALRQERAEMARREAEMAAREEVIRRQEREQAAAAKELRRESRAALLREAGVEFDERGGVWGTKNYSCYWESVGDWTDEQFAEQLSEFKADLVVMKAEQERQAAEAAREALIEERVARLKAAGWEQEGDDRIKLRWWSSDSGQSYTSIPTAGFAETSEEAIEEMVQRGHFELQRRDAAQEEAEIVAPENALMDPQKAADIITTDVDERLKQQAIAQAVAEIEAESGELVEVNRERVLRILFSVQEVLPYAQAEGNDKWNAGLEELSNDVMELRRDLGDETLGPNPNEPW
jgi:hypothetical protein